MKLHIEIRAAEGGDDAKALVLVQAALYTNYAQRHGFVVEAKTERG
jgi:protein subunit release factor A